MHAVGVFATTARNHFGTRPTGRPSTRFLASGRQYQGYPLTLAARLLALRHRSKPAPKPHVGQDAMSFVPRSRFPFPSVAPSWFIGHMAKGLRRMRETLSSIDLVLEVRDARLPLTSINPAFEELVGNDRGFLPKSGKKRLVIYNKRDLAEPGLERVCHFLSRSATGATPSCSSAVHSTAHSESTSATCRPALHVHRYCL